MQYNGEGGEALSFSQVDYNGMVLWSITGGSRNYAKNVQLVNIVNEQNSQGERQYNMYFVII